jgi:hypothetical protein
MTSATPREILDAYGFDACPVFGEAPADNGPWSLGESVDQTVTGNASVQQGLAFYNQAKAQLGGTVTAAEDQALAAINSWPGDAQNAVLAYLDPGQQALLATAMQGVQIAAQGGLTPQTFTAIAGLVATEFAGPVAGALVGSMLVTLDVMRDAILSVAATLGIPTAKGVTRSADFLCYSGWPKQGQVIPGGPADSGDGTAKNPGWQRTWDQIQAYAPKYSQCTQLPSGRWQGDPSSAGEGQWIASLPPALNGAWVLGEGPDLSMWCELQSLPKTDFRWFYYPLRYMNFDFLYNCSPIAPIDEQQLLLKSVDLWNRTHAATSTQTYAPGDGSIIGAVLGGLSNLVWQPGEAPQKASVGAITLNTGPALASAKRVIAIHLPHGTTPIGADTTAAPAAAAAAPSAAPAIAGLAVVGLGGAAWYFLGKPLTLAALKHGWRAVVEEFF